MEKKKQNKTKQNKQTNKQKQKKRTILSVACESERISIKIVVFILSCVVSESICDHLMGFIGTLSRIKKYTT